MSVLSLDIPGLNLVLGGGIPVVTRGTGLRESTTLLVRGPPGSGKTIFGLRLAGSLAAKLRCDVAYGCVEILPAELEAQHAGVVAEGVGGIIVHPPFTTFEPHDAGHRIFAATLDLGESGAEVARLVPAILGLLDEAARHGQPRILVIDSLSDGYGFGGTAPRLLADEVCKMAAQRGLVIILLEEVSSREPSVWSFATDLVFELDRQQPTVPAGLLSRHLTVSKSRFGPSDYGPHRFTILSGRGVEVYPAPLSYLQTWAAATTLGCVKRRGPDAWNWGIFEQWGPMVVGSMAPQGPFRSRLIAQKLPRFDHSVTLVFGTDLIPVIPVAAQIGAQSDEASIDVFLNVGREVIERPLLHESAAFYPVPLGDPFIGGERFIAEAISAIAALADSGKSLGRVLLGDLRNLRTFHDPESEALKLGLTVMLTFLRRAGIPVVLFQTEEPNTASRWAMLADVTVRVSTRGTPQAVVAHRRTRLEGRVESLQQFLQGPRADALIDLL